MKLIIVSAFSFALQKLHLEDDGLGLELKGIEKKGDLWVVKVTHNQDISTKEVEKRLNASYQELTNLLANKEQQINQLLGIATNQAEAIKEFSKRPFGNSFFITGSTITNLAGSQIFVGARHCRAPTVWSIYPKTAVI